MEILWLSEEDVKTMLSVKDALPLVEEAFASLARGDAQMPPKVYLNFQEFHGDLRAMPSYLPKTATPSGSPYAGVKIVNSHPENPAQGLPTVAAVLVLNDPRTGMPLAILSAGRLTDIRTGAAGGVAAKYMARQGAASAGLVGCGRQAVTQLEALRAVFHLSQVRVAGRSLEEAQRFCHENSSKFPSVVFTADKHIEDACRADIIVTTTPSRNPVVQAEWIRPGTHINAIGADAPGKQELESALLTEARVVVDRGVQAFHSGEVNVPLAQGVLKREQIVGELGEVVLGRKKPRQSDEDITIFDSTGLAVQDIAAAAWVFEKALEMKKGTKLKIS